jgi:butyrate kinase
MKILTINPGSTTTKIALFEDKETLFEHKFDHNLDNKTSLEDRLSLIFQFLEEKNISSLDAVIGRGGMLPPISSGTYEINQKMLEDLINRPQAQHASNLGAPLAKNIADKFQVKSYIANPVTTDEIDPKHKITGFKEIKRYAAWHCLNQKAVAHEYAKSIGKNYEDLNLLIAHLGGGSSFAAHKKGQAVNVLNALSGEGPFTPERAGALPAQNLIDLCFSGQFSKEELHRKVAGNGGLASLLDTKDVYSLRQNYDNLDQNTKDILDEMIYAISRSICSLIPDFDGEKIDQILITGGIAQWPLVTDKIKLLLENLNIGITLYPGEKELESLRDCVLRVLSKEECSKTYN